MPSSFWIDLLANLFAVRIYVNPEIEICFYYKCSSKFFELFAFKSKIYIDFNYFWYSVNVETVLWIFEPFFSLFVQTFKHARLLKWSEATIGCWFLFILSLYFYPEKSNCISLPSSFSSVLLQLLVLWKWGFSNFFPTWIQMVQFFILSKKSCRMLAQQRMLDAAIVSVLVRWLNSRTPMTQVRMPEGTNILAFKKDISNWVEMRWSYLE